MRTFLLSRHAAIDDASHRERIVERVAVGILEGTLVVDWWSRTDLPHELRIAQWLFHNYIVIHVSLIALPIYSIDTEWDSREWRP